MRIKNFLFCLLLLAHTSAEPLRHTSVDPDGDGPLPSAPRIEGRLVLQFHNPLSHSDLKLWGTVHGLAPRWTSEHGAKHGLAVIDVEESSLPATLQLLQQDPLLRIVSPDYLVQSHSQGAERELKRAELETKASFPNDPRFKEQWHLQMMGVPKAWKKASGEGVVLALLDTGIAYKDKEATKAVEDLAQTKVLEGYDFINDDPHAVDDHSCGTHMAGILAQSTNNKLGVAGVAYESSLLPVKVLNHKGSGSFSAIADGIRYAADRGAHIIVMGFGSSADHILMEEAVQYAHRKGVLLVGSSRANGGDTPGFPADYEEVLAVGAVAIDRSVTGYSSRGVDLTAPGGYAGPNEGILQNTIHQYNPKRDGYFWLAGTNCAAANVGGVAALIMSCGVTDPADVREILTSTATKKRDKEAYGAGIVNAQKAVKKALAKRSAEAPQCPGTLAWVGFLALLGVIGKKRLGRA